MQTKPTDNSFNWFQLYMIQNPILFLKNCESHWTHLDTTNQMRIFIVKRAHTDSSTVDQHLLTKGLGRESSIKGQQQNAVGDAQDFGFNHVLYLVYLHVSTLRLCWKQCLDMSGLLVSNIVQLATSWSVTIKRPKPQTSKLQLKRFSSNCWLQRSFSACIACSSEVKPHHERLRPQVKATRNSDRVAEIIP